jgi:ribosomal protein S18 acetylase RimI-like enzyme
MSGIEIKHATAEDAVEILALQRLAYQSEADLYSDPTIPPLTQTLEGLVKDFADKVFLKAVSDSGIVGSVRVHWHGHTVHVERLIVAPSHQGVGIGTELMRRAEALHHDAQRCELFTGHKSVRNIRLYQRLGYRQFKREVLHDGLEIVFLEKVLSPVNEG